MRVCSVQVCSVQVCSVQVCSVQVCSVPRMVVSDTTLLTYFCVCFFFLLYEQFGRRRHRWDGPPRINRGWGGGRHGHIFLPATTTGLCPQRIVDPGTIAATYPSTVARVFVTVVRLLFLHCGKFNFCQPSLAIGVLQPRRPRLANNEQCDCAAGRAGVL